jgi:hypothetical protein
MATDFETWFSSEFQRDIKLMPSDTTVLSNGLDIAAASWDRRCAYLLWTARGRPVPQWKADVAKLRRPAPGQCDETIDLEEAIAAVANPADPLGDLFGDAPPPVDPLGDMLG